jgi:hypothetical protein
MTMSLIETKTLGTAAASIEFTSIPQTFTDLVISLSLRGSNASATINTRVALNPTNSNHSFTFLYGNPPGGNGVSGSATGQTYVNCGEMTAATGTSNTFSNTTVYIPNYSGSTNKSVSVDAGQENNSTSAFPFLVAGLYSATTAVSALSFFAASGNLEIGSTISLYGITKRL